MFENKENLFGKIPSKRGTQIQENLLTHRKVKHQYPKILNTLNFELKVLWTAEF